MTEPDRGPKEVEARSVGGEPFRLLYLCTGNTCRSPLAEGLTRRALAARGWDHVEVRSAGVAAFPSGPASRGSIGVAAQHDLDLSTHKSTPLSPELVAWADLILTMSPGHLRAVESWGGGKKAAVITDFAAEQAGAGPSGVPDPHGGEAAEYQATFEILESLVEQTLARLAPLVSP
ncbi:MAG: low molecular weight protein arginine phosphatase [Gemmatimonadota bacterium]